MMSKEEIIADVEKHEGVEVWTQWGICKVNWIIWDDIGRAEISLTEDGRTFNVPLDTWNEIRPK